MFARRPHRQETGEFGAVGLRGQDFPAAAREQSVNLLPQFRTRGCPGGEDGGGKIRVLLEGFDGGMQAHTEGGFARIPKTGDAHVFLRQGGQTAALGGGQSALRLQGGAHDLRPVFGFHEGVNGVEGEESGTFLVHAGDYTAMQRAFRGGGLVLLRGRRAPRTGEFRGGNTPLAGKTLRRWPPRQELALDSRAVLAYTEYAMLLISIIIKSIDQTAQHPPETHMNVEQAIEAYLESIAEARSAHTERAYRNALSLFAAVLRAHGQPPAETAPQALGLTCVNWFAAALKTYAPATEQLYLTALKGFLEFLIAEGRSPLNLTQIRRRIRLRARRAGVRLPQFPQEDIERVIEYAKYLTSAPTQDAAGRLRSLRDRAFLLALADTGLRVHEACALRRGDVDWREGRAVIIGKGDKQAVVRFSRRSLRALQDYLEARASLDGAQGKPLGALPLFARHDRGAGKKIKPITTATGRNIVRQRVREALGEQAVGSITPHSFRHYFVTTVLRGSGGNLKLAQKLARHENIAVTQRYAHLSDDELDRVYYEIFDQNAPET